MKKESINNFISYCNKDKISNVISFIWMGGMAFAMLDVFCLQSRFKLFTTSFFYYITPIVAIIIIVRMIILFRRFKNMEGKR